MNHSHSEHTHDDHTECSHGHSHDHGGHGHHHHVPTTFGKAFALTLIVNLVYVAIEVAWGFFANSMSLLADAGHNTVDLLSLFAAWGAHVLATRKARGRFTYGLQKATILTALTNGLILSFVTGGLLYASILRLNHPVPVEGYQAALIIAGGIVINLVSALLLLRGSKEDLNIKGAFLHLMGDAAFGGGILAANIAIALTGWNILDPIIGIAVSLFILYSAIMMSLEALNMAMDAAPPKIEVESVLKELQSIPDVHDAHHLHIWALSTSETALTVHLAITDYSKMENILEEAQHRLKTNFKISHSTIQVEAEKKHDCGTAGGVCC